MEMYAWEFAAIAESAWLASWEAPGAPVFPGNFEDFVAQKDRFLAKIEDCWAAYEVAYEKERGEDT